MAPRHRRSRATPRQPLWIKKTLTIRILNGWRGAYLRWRADDHGAGPWAARANGVRGVPGWRCRGSSPGLAEHGWRGAYLRWRADDHGAGPAARAPGYTVGRVQPHRKRL